IRAERAEAIYRQAEAEFKRIEILFKKDNISASQFEKARAEYVSAKTAYETASNELKDTKLIAPFDGYVGEVFIEKFQDVKPTQQIISFDEINRLKIEIYVPQAIAFNAQQLKTVDLVFDAITGENFTANVQEISKSTTQNNISYLLTAMLPNSDEKLLAGMSGKLDLHIAGNVQTIIPQSALRHRPTLGDYVWVIDPATSVAKRRVVKTGKLLSSGEIAIEEGLTEGEVIALTGQDFIADGDVVVINNK
ncbi:MAG: efflux RND transporter periplasmic adaptor subunit, partial [Rikenellaceae bacterium]